MDGTGVSARRGFAALVAGLLVLGVGGLRPVRVGATTTYEAVAGADGVRISLRVPDAPVTDTPVDSGGPTAQAVLNSSGVSRAFAAHPYPGEAVVTGPGTVAGVTGGQVNLPGYPFYVSSDHPTVPEQANEQGPYRLEATSAERQSEAESRAGGDAGPLVTSVARVEVRDDSGTSAEALSVVESFAAAEVHLGRVHSRARVTRAPDGSLTRSSELEVTGFTVAGTAVGIGPQGLTVAGGTVPLPSTDPVRQALAGAGITVTYLAAQEQPTGVIAPGLAVTAPLSLPGSPMITVTYTLGQASAAVGGEVLSDDGLDALPPVTSEVAAPPAGETPPPLTDTGFASDPTLSEGPPGSFVAPPDLAAPGSAPAQLEAAPVISPSPLGPLAERGDFDTSSFFAVLVAGALVAFGLVSLFSLFGVRWRWTS